jgi:hypothetical protein
MEKIIEEYAQAVTAIPIGTVIVTVFVMILLKVT